jgi:hypothetical protein
MTPTDLIARLRGRAETCWRNAGAFEREGYHAQALVQLARAAAYEVAADDAELVDEIAEVSE